MKRAQELLYQWLIERGSVRYEQIKYICDYLNLLCDIGLEKPINRIFYPLIYNGIVDSVGGNSYHVTPTCIIYNNKRSIIVNPLQSNNLEKTSHIGIYRGQYECANSYEFNLNSILSRFPTIGQYIHSMECSLYLSTSDFTKKSGVVQRSEDSLKRYFLEENKCYSLPHQSVNPDAINIAHCYERVVNSNHNGEYDDLHNILKIKYLRFPIMIFRLLLIESLLNGSEISKENGYYVINHIDRKTYHELNRIFCNSIKQLK